jgi:hypothetical protein
MIINYTFAMHIPISLRVVYDARSDGKLESFFYLSYRDFALGNFTRNEIFDRFYQSTHHARGNYSNYQQFGGISISLLK